MKKLFTNYGSAPLFGSPYKHIFKPCTCQVPIRPAFLEAFVFWSRWDPQAGELFAWSNVNQKQCSGGRRLMKKIRQNTFFKKKLRVRYQPIFPYSELNQRDFIAFFGLYWLEVLTKYCKRLNHWIVDGSVTKRSSNSKLASFQDIQETISAGESILPGKMASHSHVLVYHGPLLIYLLDAFGSCAIYFHHCVINHLDLTSILLSNSSPTRTPPPAQLTGPLTPISPPPKKKTQRKPLGFWSCFVRQETSDPTWPFWSVDRGLLQVLWVRWVGRWRYNRYSLPTPRLGVKFLVCQTVCLLVVKAW